MRESNTRCSTWELNKEKNEFVQIGIDLIENKLSHHIAQYSSTSK